MTENSWPAQQHSGPHPTMGYPPTAHFPHSSYNSAYPPQTGPPPYDPTAYFTNYGPGFAPASASHGAAPSRPSPHWPLVVLAVLMSGLLGGAVAVYHATQVRRRWMAGDVRGAAKASRSAKNWAITGISVGAILLAVAVAVMSTGGPVAVGTLGKTSSQVPALETPPAATATETATSVDPTLSKPAGLDSSESAVFDALQSNLQRAVDRLDRGEDPTFQCIAVLVTADAFAAGFETAATTATEQCGREIPIAWTVHQLDSAAAKSGPIDAIMECATAQIALDTVEQRFVDPRVGELRTRSDQVCR